MNTRSGSNDSDHEAADARGRVSLPKAIGRARHQLESLTGRAVDSVTSARADDGGWTMDLEVVELERIPASTSVLGSYRVMVDRGGDIVEYERTRRYYRNQPSEAELL